MIIYKNVVFKCLSVRIQNVLVMFDAFEYEADNDCIWLFRNGECACLMDSDSHQKSTQQIISQLERLGAVNHGDDETRKQDEAPQVGADSSLIQ